MDRLLDSLKIVMGLGVAALAAIVVALIVVGTRHHSTPHAAAPTAVPTPRVVTTPAATPAPISSPSANVALTAPQKCERRHTACSQALLELINRARIQQPRSPLILDALQSRGIPATASIRRCVGSRGHSKAMARSGHLWRRNRAYRTASFPRDICYVRKHPGEAVAAASGTEWTALKRAAGHLLARGRKNAATRRLLAGRYHRAGIGIAQRRGRFYVTIDLLR